MSRVENAAKHSKKHVWEVLETVHDPEIPVLSVIDLGIVQQVNVDEDRLEVVITPTYSGCPAMDAIQVDIARALAEAGYGDAKITTVLSPPWTTDWLSEAGREKLRAFGIAPPDRPSTSKRALFSEVSVACPHCGSEDTECVSEFGSTACKAHYRCRSCAEPFDYFKCI